MHACAQHLWRCSRLTLATTGAMAAHCKLQKVRRAEIGHSRSNDSTWYVIQVRSAATMGGNLALAKQQGLESDAATLLAALGARIAVVSTQAEEPRWVHKS